MDADIMAAVQKRDPEKQKALRFGMQRIDAEQLPVLALSFGSQAHGIRKG